MDTLILVAVVGSVVFGMLALKKLSDRRARTYFYDEEENVSPVFLDFEVQDNDRIRQRALEEIQRLKAECEEHFRNIDAKIEENNEVADDDIQILNDMWAKSEMQNSVVDNSIADDADTDETYEGKTDEELIQETLKAIQRFSETLDRLSKALQEEEEKQQRNRSDELDI